MASAYAEALGANLAIVAKERKSATETEALYLIGDVEDRDVLLVDDLTETAGHPDLGGRDFEKARGARRSTPGSPTPSWWMWPFRGCKSPKLRN